MPFGERSVVRSHFTLSRISPCKSTGEYEGELARRGQVSWRSSSEGWRNYAELVFGDDVHLDLHRLFTGRQHYAVDGGDIGVIAPDCQCDVIILHQDGVGGVETDPTSFFSTPQ